ncbi:alpha/beta hydrolase [Pseudonocardia sp. TRM90224]|uniref:alpha/beta hydrolase n=1 Tax=Pseudonocardia sp. TRM90224 TaxID=2812678 RepID=UPI001E4AE8FE|nr:alpha/beta hydrolase [Pseudonocardia sp. TRM90224]
MRSDSGARGRSGHGDKLTFYQFGRTTMYASQTDQRFSYCLYVPSDYDESADTVYPLVVVVHGTGRDAQGYRDQFVDFAEQHGCIVFSPLFPAGIDEPGELHNYKYLEFNGTRYDHVLLGMLEEIARIWRVDTSRFLLSGFSGGGHFTHRFLYTHPDRLLGAAVGAPGVVTLLDEERQWPAGVGGLEAALGVRLDLDAIRDVPVLLVVGGDDTETWEIGITPDLPQWIEGVNDVGVNRQVRMEALKGSLVAHGVRVRHDVVPGVAHHGYQVLAPVREFFATTLAAARAGAADRP